MMVEPIKIVTSQSDEVELIDAFRKAKKEQFATLILEIHNGEISKLHWTHKVNLERFRRLKENAQQI